MQLIESSLYASQRTMGELQTLASVGLTTIVEPVTYMGSPRRYVHTYLDDYERLIAAEASRCAEVGIESFSFDPPDTVTRQELLGLVELLNKDSRVDGILVQLPLPDGLDANEIMDAIDPTKDVDGFHPTNTGLLAQKRPHLRACTPFGVIRLAQEYGIKLAGTRSTVVGASNIVGRPMALELLLAGSTVTVCHSRTRDLRSEVARADIVVAAIGKPEMIKGDWIAEGAVVFDVGMNRLDSGKLVGDVDFAGASQRAGWITPVPGGVGPMTIAMLLSNTMNSAIRRAAG